MTSWYALQQQRMQQQQQQRQSRQSNRQRQAPPATPTTRRRPPLHPSSSNGSLNSAASTSTSSSSRSLRRRSNSNNMGPRRPPRSAFKHLKNNANNDRKQPALKDFSDSSSTIGNGWNNTRSHNYRSQAMEAGQLPTDKDLPPDPEEEERQLLKKKQARKKQKEAWKERSMQKKRLRDIKYRNMRQSSKDKEAAVKEAEAVGSDKENSNINGPKNNKEGKEEEVNQQEEEASKKQKKKDKYEVDIMQLAPDEKPPEPSCCRRYLSERNPCYDWYMVKDKLIGKRLDAAATFCPQSRKDRMFKMICTATVLAALVMNILDYREKYGTIDMGFLCYLENIGMVFSNFYMLMSMLNSIFGAQQPWDVIEGRMRWSWMTFVMASHTEVMMTVMYWSLLYGGPGVTKLDFLTVMKYGGVAVQVVWDGLSVNRIPLRWMYWWGCLWMMNLMYFFVFAPLYSFFFCSDLAIPGASTALYPFLDWKGDWEYTIIVGVIFCLALSPAVFLGLWCMSLYQWPLCFCCCKESRRYLLTRSQQRKLNEKKTEAHRKKKEAKEAEEEALLMLKKNPMTSQDDSTPSTDKKDSRNVLSRIYGYNRRRRAAAARRALYSPGDETTATYLRDDSTEFTTGKAQKQQREQRRRKLRERKQLEELHPRYAESMVYHGQLQLQEQQQEQQQQQQQQQETNGGGGWGVDLRSFLGGDVSNNNNNSNQSRDSRGCGSSSISSISFGSGDSSKHSYRGSAREDFDHFGNNREEFNDEEAQCNNYSYPWDNCTESQSGGFKDVGVVLGNDDDEDGDEKGFGTSNTPDNSEYKYPWDRDGSEGSMSLTFL